jgi:hypothetical protein
MHIMVGNLFLLLSLLEFGLDVFAMALDMG